MTAKPTATEPLDPTGEVAGDDQASYTYAYGHGRMPVFMKLIWLGFLVFAAWYIVSFLLVALEADLGLAG